MLAALTILFLILIVMVCLSITYSWLRQLR